MTSFPKISRRARDKYHNLKDDDIMKDIFNSGRYKDKVGMKILDWIISEEMNHTEHYRMYAEMFGLDVPLTQSQPTKSTQGTHRTPSAPRSPNPKMDTAESSAPKRLTVIHFYLPERRSTRLTPPAPVPTNVINDSLLPRNDEPNILSTRLETRSDKESPEVEITNDKEVEITNDKEVEITNDEEVEFTNVVILVNVNEEEEEITNEVYELKQREKGKIYDPHLQQQDIAIWLALQIKFEIFQVPQTTCRTSAVCPRDQDDPHDDAYPEGENSAKRQKTSEYEAYMSVESSSR
ncbi:hypothetical protein Tco_0098754 [Tanacetum coccineum]